MVVSLSACIQSFRNAIKKKDQTFVSPRSQKILAVLFFLQKHGIIRRIQYIQKNFVLVTLQQSLSYSVFLRGITLFPTCENRYIPSINLNRLVSLQKTRLFIVSTPLGLLSGNQACNKNVGGVLLGWVDF